MNCTKLPSFACHWPPDISVYLNVISLLLKAFSRLMQEKKVCHVIIYFEHEIIGGPSHSPFLMTRVIL